MKNLEKTVENIAKEILEDMNEAYFKNMCVFVADGLICYNVKDYCDMHAGTIIYIPDLQDDQDIIEGMNEDELVKYYYDEIIDSIYMYI